LTSIIGKKPGSVVMSTNSGSLYLKTPAVQHHLVLFNNYWIKVDLGTSDSPLSSDPISLSLINDDPSDLSNGFSSKSKGVKLLPNFYLVCLTNPHATKFEPATKCSFQR